MKKAFFLILKLIVSTFLFLFKAIILYVKFIVKLSEIAQKVDENTLKQAEERKKKDRKMRVGKYDDDRLYFKSSLREK